MKKYLTKRNIYITLFTILYLAVGIVSLIHSFAFFGLANTPIMAIMLGCCFEIGQVAVLMSLLTSKKEQSRVMPYLLMGICTIVQILGNIFSSYKYLMLHSTSDLTYFRQPIFIWTDLPDDITTVIITYIVGAILPIIALCMTSMVSNYIMESDDSTKKIESDESKINEDEKIKQERIEIKEENLGAATKTDTDIQYRKQDNDENDRGDVKDEEIQTVIDNESEEESRDIPDNDKLRGAEGDDQESKEEEKGDEQKEDLVDKVERVPHNHFVNLH